MADVTGPISTMPGSRHKTPAGQMCDDHPDRPAVSRRQGETDSMGSEMHDLCQECSDKWDEETKNASPRIGRCDWCKAENVETRNRRDWEEGSCGRIYDVCLSCIAEDTKAIQAEADAMDEELGSQHYEDHDHSAWEDNDDELHDPWAQDDETPIPITQEEWDAMEEDEDDPPEEDDEDA